MHIWGLTGGIASGKTTVARAFADLGVVGINADALYHGLVAADAAGQPSALTRRIGEIFPGSIAANGSLDRPFLANQVFADPAARARLEKVSHPAVQAAAAAALAQLEAAGHTHALYDVPLLYERNLAARFAGVVVVWVPQALQLMRLQQRDGLGKKAAQARLDAQWPLDAKRAQATWVIDNSGDSAATLRQVADVAARMAVFGT